MKFVLWFLVVASPCLAQFETIEIAFEGVGCASCIASLPSRIQRLRGVEAATVDADRSILKVQLAPQSRVRLEQVRDLLEQDGTKAKRAAVRVKGELSQQNGKYVLRPTGLATTYEIEGGISSPPSGVYAVTGDIASLAPESGSIVIRASAVKKIAASQQ